MIPMLARAIQYLLAIIGFLFLGVALFNIRTNAAAVAGGGFFQSLEEHLKLPLYLFLGVLSLLGAYRISKWRNKKSARQISSHHKG